MLKRPNTGVNIQNIFNQAMHNDQKRFMSIKSVYQTNQDLKKNVFIPTIKEKKRNRNIKSCTMRNNFNITNQKIQQQKKPLNFVQKEPIKANHQEQKLHLDLSKINNKNYIEEDNSIQELGDFMKNYLDQNNYFEKHILESTKHQSGGEILAYQDNEIDCKKKNYKEIVDQAILKNQNLFTQNQNQTKNQINKNQIQIRIQSYTNQKNQQIPQQQFQQKRSQALSARYQKRQQFTKLDQKNLFQNIIKNKNIQE